MTVQQFGAKQGLGEDGRVSGLKGNTKKKMLADGMKGERPIDLLSASFPEARSQTEAAASITGDAGVATGTRRLGIWKCASNPAAQHVCAMQIKWLREAGVRTPFRKTQQSAERLKKSLCIHS